MSQIVLDPFPLTFGINCLDRGTIERAMHHHMAIDDGNDLEVTTHAMPEQAVCDAYFRRPQKTARAIDSALRTGFAFARGTAL